MVGEVERETAMKNDNPDHVHGCYCYRSLTGYTVVHVFVNNSRKCGCGNRELKSTNHAPPAD